MGVSSFLVCGSWESNLGYQNQWQAPYSLNCLTDCTCILLKIYVIKFFWISIGNIYIVALFSAVSLSLSYIHVHIYTYIYSLIYCANEWIQNIMNNICDNPYVCVYIYTLYHFIFWHLIDMHIYICITSGDQKVPQSVLYELSRPIGALCQHLVRDRYPHHLSWSFLICGKLLLKQKALVLKLQAMQTNFKTVWAHGMRRCQVMVI